MPALATNSLSVTFGDFSRGYTIVQRKTITLLHDPNTNKPYVRFYTTMRVGGDVSDFHATRFIKFA
jgi:HK97 family phage major capsid protein